MAHQSLRARATSARILSIPKSTAMIRAIRMTCVVFGFQASADLHASVHRWGDEGLYVKHHCMCVSTFEDSQDDAHCYLPEPGLKVCSIILQSCKDEVPGSSCLRSKDGGYSLTLLGGGGGGGGGTIASSAGQEGSCDKTCDLTWPNKFQESSLQ